jgi:hypothetical protein
MFCKCKKQKEELKYLKIKVKGGGKVFLLEVYFIHRI